MSEEKKELINEELNDEKKELTQEELEQVTGGEAPSILTKLGLGAIRLPQGETYSAK